MRTWLVASCIAATMHGAVLLIPVSLGDAPVAREPVRLQWLATARPARPTSPARPESSARPPAPEPTPHAIAPPHVVAERPQHRQPARRSEARRLARVDEPVIESDSMIEPAADPAGTGIWPGAAIEPPTHTALDHSLPAPAAADVSPAPDLAAYAQLVRARIEAEQRYPARARRMNQSGTATLLVRVRPDGQLDAAPQLSVSSGVAALDREALRMASAAAPFPASRHGAVMSISVPVRFSLP